MKRVSAWLLVFALIAPLLAPRAALRAADPALPDGLYAEFATPRGVFTCELFFQKAPLMCANFTGLAEGTLAPRDGKPLYTGLTFYRVVPGFVIQSGNPGLKDTDDEKTPIPHHFPDEFAPGLHHDSAGILSMANAGPDTNSCEFFLTLAPTNRLNYLHSVFGRTVRGLEVLPQIKQDDPVSIKIVRLGAAARAFRNDPATFAALSAEAKKYSAVPTATKEPSPTSHFHDPDKLLPAEPPRAKNFNYKLANFERATGVRMVARLFRNAPPAAEDNAPGRFMRALAAQLGTARDGILVAHFADDDWRVWIGDTLTARFVGRPVTAADLGEDGALHDLKEKLLDTAQAEGDAAYERQKKSSPADKQPPPAQRLKLQTDAVLDALILKFETK